MKGNKKVVTEISSPPFSESSLPLTPRSSPREEETRISISRPLMSSYKSQATKEKETVMSQGSTHSIQDASSPSVPHEIIPPQYAEESPQMGSVVSSMFSTPSSQWYNRKRRTRSERSYDKHYQRHYFLYWFVPLICIPILVGLGFFIWAMVREARKFREARDVSAINNHGYHVVLPAGKDVVTWAPFLIKPESCLSVQEAEEIDKMTASGRNFMLAFPKQVERKRSIPILVNTFRTKSKALSNCSKGDQEKFVKKFEDSLRTPLSPMAGQQWRKRTSSVQTKKIQRINLNTVEVLQCGKNAGAKEKLEFKILGLLETANSFLRETSNEQIAALFAAVIDLMAEESDEIKQISSNHDEMNSLIDSFISYDDSKVRRDGSLQASPLGVDTAMSETSNNMTEPEEAPKSSGGYEGVIIPVIVAGILALMLIVLVAAKGLKDYGPSVFLRRRQAKQLLLNSSPVSQNFPEKFGTQTPLANRERAEYDMEAQRTVESHPPTNMGLDGCLDGWTNWLSSKSNSKAQAEKQNSQGPGNKVPRLPSLRLPKASFCTLRSFNGNGLDAVNSRDESRIKWGSTI